MKGTAMSNEEEFVKDLLKRQGACAGCRLERKDLGVWFGAWFCDDKPFCGTLARAFEIWERAQGE